MWPGVKSPHEADEDYFTRAAEELRLLCRMAAPKGITVSTEFHPGSLTETPEGALHLLELAGMGSTYWQCDPDRTFDWNDDALRKVLPQMSNVHVFYWNNGEHRLLSEGWKDWSSYLRTIGPSSCRKRDFILEFARDGEPQAFLQDAAVLKRLMDWVGSLG